MTLKEANIKLKQLENDLNYWIEKKNIAIESVMPKATNYTSERVDGGKRVDKYAKLDISIEEIDPIIDKLNKEINSLSDWIDNELKIIREYEPLKAKIIKLRDEYHLRWNVIAEATNYSERHCKRVYKDYYKKRNID